MKVVILFAFFLFTSLASAGLITVDYQFDHPSYTDLAGSFSGIDHNSDGWLTFEELDAWNTIYRFPGDLSDLNDIGDFNFENNIWVPNAKQWDQVTQDAYMTWGDWQHSASTSNAFFSQWGSFRTKVTIIPVTEPSSLLLLGIGIFALTVFRKKGRERVSGWA